MGLKRPIGEGFPESTPPLRSISSVIFGWACQIHSASWHEVKFLQPQMHRLQAHSEPASKRSYLLNVREIGGPKPAVESLFDVGRWHQKHSCEPVGRVLHTSIRLQIAYGVSIPP